MDPLFVKRTTSETTPINVRYRAAKNCMHYSILRLKKFVVVAGCVSLLHSFLCCPDSTESTSNYSVQVSRYEHTDKEPTGE